MRQPVITRQMQVDFAIHNVGVERAKRAYYGEDEKPCGCSHLVTCAWHRGVAAADLRVATSEEECERLLGVLSLPAPLCANADCDRRRDGRRPLCWSCRKAAA